jgi:hypothetical protein
MTAWTPGGTITISGSGFVRATSGYINGALRQTTYVSDTEMRIEVTGADLNTQATSIAVTVATPPPGGGTSAAVPLVLTQPSLSVDTTTASPGQLVTVTLTNGSGVAADWIAIARVGDPNTTYLNWTNVGAGNTTFVWKTSMPTSPTSYEFRLFSNGSYTRSATSPTVTVGTAQPPPPPPPPPSPNPPSLAVDTTTATPGAMVTVTLTNGSGVAADWIALARVGDPNTTYLNWTNVGTGNTTFVWKASMPTSPNSYEFRLFSNGSYTRTATSPTVTVGATQSPPPPPPPPSPNPPSLAVDTTTASPGAMVTVTLTNGSGVAADWIAIARVGDPNTTYLNWTNVGAGNTTFVWKTSMPTSPNNYEFRLFSNGSYTRTATSPTVTVAAAQPPPPPPPPPSPNPPSLTVDTTVASPGAAVTVTLTNGTGVAADWISLARVGDPNTTYLNWTSVGAGNTTFVWRVNVPFSPNNYEFRLFSNGSYTRTATSPTVQVVP